MTSGWCLTPSPGVCMFHCPELFRISLLREQIPVFCQSRRGVFAWVCGLGEEIWVFNGNSNRLWIKSIISSSPLSPLLSFLQFFGTFNSWVFQRLGAQLILLCSGFPPCSGTEWYKEVNITQSLPTHPLSTFWWYLLLTDVSFFTLCSCGVLFYFFCWPIMGFGG